jgi:hypothetical protein
MSFVSFSADETMVASDGPAAPDDVSHDLTLWNFVDGRLIGQLSAESPGPFPATGNTTPPITAFWKWKLESR